MDNFKAVLLRDPCAYCDAPGAVIDHIVSRRQGGENDWSNYTAACANCNADKKVQTLLSFLLFEPVGWYADYLAQRQLEREWVRARRLAA